MTVAYYNEFEPFAADWLGNLARKGLIADGTIDRRSIADVTPDDVFGFGRVHFFAGIGGWEYALQLAGWPDDRQVWTGSAPCQPFSLAGKRHGESDKRHLWPEMRRLVAECRPATILGEQVASRDGREWLARVRDDLEAMGYAVGAADLCAPSVGAPHVRQRLFWVANAGSIRRQGSADDWRSAPRINEKVGAAFSRGPARCRRSLVKHLRGLPPGDGISAVVEKRVIRGYGNAIVPQVAAIFIRAFMEATS